MESFDELDFTQLESPEDVETMLKEKMGIGLQFMQDRLAEVLKEKAGELILDFSNIAPNGDYSKLLEDVDGMTEFLKTEAAKPENWKIHELQVIKQNPSLPLLECIFLNSVVDDGSTLEGYVFLSKSGFIRHAFVQGNGKG